MLPKAIIIYSSVDGQTKKIAQHLSKLMQNTHVVDVFFIRDLHTSIKEYDKILIASSVRYGKHNEEIEKLITSHVQFLNSRKTAFISVNLVARKKEKSEAHTNPYVKKFLSATAWKPLLVGVFAGKLDYSLYDWKDKILIKLIMLLTKGPIRTSTAIEYTDWSSVDKFAQKILKM